MGRETRTVGPVRDLVGQRFGLLLVLCEAGRNRHKNALWLARCDCGTERVFVGNNLTRGGTKSCGCLQRKLAGTVKRTHGLSKMVEHRIWMEMRARCNNPRGESYANYGGRGIQVCERWAQFPNFLADMGERPSPQHSIDRIDNNRGYEPGNCRWATRIEQNNNTRQNRPITYRGEMMTIAEAARRAGSIVTGHQASSRVRSGWSPERAVETPLIPRQLHVVAARAQLAALKRERTERRSGR